VEDDDGQAPFLLDDRSEMANDGISDEDLSINVADAGSLYLCG